MIKYILTYKTSVLGDVKSHEQTFTTEEEALLSKKEMECYDIGDLIIYDFKINGKEIE
jgi:hypothetical protein